MKPVRLGPGDQTQVRMTGPPERAPPGEQGQPRSSAEAGGVLGSPTWSSPGRVHVPGKQDEVWATLMLWSAVGSFCSAPFSGKAARRLSSYEAQRQLPGSADLGHGGASSVALSLLSRKNKVSTPQHCWDLGPDTSSLWGAVTCIIGCFAASSTTY